jgi:hypothetical protein
MSLILKFFQFIKFIFKEVSNSMLIESIKDWLLSLLEKLKTLRPAYTSSVSISKIEKRIETQIDFKWFKRNVITKISKRNDSKKKQ